MDGAIIYVAGNPELYPVEYYDPDSQSYQGALPEFLAGFAQAYGYDLRYLQPGAEDRRIELAENQQVDVISGCEAKERYAHTSGEPVLLFSGGTEGEETVYALFLTQTAPAVFRPTCGNMPPGPPRPSGPAPSWRPPGRRRRPPCPPVCWRGPAWGCLPC